jgi:hypothetical protein
LFEAAFADLPNVAPTPAAPSQPRNFLRDIDIDLPQHLTTITKECMPGPESQALISPNTGGVCRYITNGIMEWWKNGIMGIKSG